MKTQLMERERFFGLPGSLLDDFFMPPLAVAAAGSAPIARLAPGLHVVQEEQKRAEMKRREREARREASRMRARQATPYIED